MLLSSHITLLGAGPESTHIVLTPGPGRHILTNRHSQGNECIELRGFTLHGELASPDRPFEGARAFAFGVFLKNVRGVVIDSVDAYGIRQTGFQFSNCRHVAVTNVNAEEMGFGAIGTSCTDDIVLRKIVVSGASVYEPHSGIHLDGSTGAYVEALVDGCPGGNGIMLDSTSAPLSGVVVHGIARGANSGMSLSGSIQHELSNVFVTGEYSNNSTCGIRVSNASNIFIVGAVVASNGEHGIVLQGHAGARRCVIADCQIIDNPSAVVELHASRDNYRTGNTETKHSS